MDFGADIMILLASFLGARIEFDESISYLQDA